MWAALSSLRAFRITQGAAEGIEHRRLATDIYGMKERAGDERLRLRHGIGQGRTEGELGRDGRGQTTPGAVAMGNR